MTRQRQSPVGLPLIETASDFWQFALDDVSPNPKNLMNFPCPVCNVSLKLVPELAGKRVQCPSCQKPFDIPADIFESPEIPVSPDVNMLRVSCPGCDTMFQTHREHIGKKAPCAVCGDIITLLESPETTNETIKDDHKCSSTEANETVELEAQEATAAGKDPDDLKGEYWCFISYRHDDNRDEGRQWASWLHQQLETYEIPEELVGTLNEKGQEIPTRIFPVFRDEEELGAGADLTKKIYDALDRSRNLVVLCSPRVLESQYVDKEIRYFKRTGKENSIYAAIIDGEPATKEEWFPDSLKFEVGQDGVINRNRDTAPQPTQGPQAASIFSL